MIFVSSGELETLPERRKVHRKRAEDESERNMVKRDLELKGKINAIIAMVGMEGNWYGYLSLLFKGV